MTTKNSLSIIVYSYKGKFLKKVLDEINNNTVNDFSVLVIDQHPLIRHNILPESDRFFYRHIFWDFIQSPCLYKHHELNSVNSEYVAIISDDILVSHGWDQRLIDFLGERNAVVSGTGQKTVVQVDKFFLGTQHFPSEGFNLTQYVDRNFMFGRRESFIKAGYPTEVKYHGEEELLSLRLFKSGIDIWSAPDNIYTDQRLRPIDNLYVPYSKTHNYNQAIDQIRNSLDDMDNVRTTRQFLEFHRLDINNLKKLPFPYQDVEYDPNDLAFQQVDARKFAAVTKAIY